MKKPPLLVHLIFHPGSKSARELATAIHRALNDDSELPGLRVPTRFACEDGSGFAPIFLDLDEAERSVVVILADDKMVIEPTIVPEGRMLWSEFVAELYERCEDSPHRLIPVQLSANVYPLDDRLAGASFLRGNLQREDDLVSWAIRALIVEICRFLHGDKRGNRMPLRLFLSHAKQDINESPEVFTAIVNHLTATQPVETWVDSAKIPGGSQFADEIEAGVRDCALLALVTKSYSIREWCRKEMLLAKRHQRPLVVIDASEGVEIRSFPYGGNTPRIRWFEGGAAAAVDLLLKETLRHQHSILVLDREKKEADHILASSPEPTTVGRSPKGSTILYPDPPVGDEEEEELEALGREIITPLQRAGEGRLLAKKQVILSMSESADSLRHGLTADHFNAAAIEISRQLLVRGAVLEYGGHLGSDGYTCALFDMAMAHNNTSGLRPAERIINDVGWPLPLEKLPDAVRAKFQRQAQFRRIKRPEDVAHLEPETFVEEPEFFPPDTPTRRYAWARGMTAMRRFQAEEGGAIARMVIGGKTGPTLTALPDGTKKESWYSGRIPGVIEEILFSLRAGQPVFLVGAFGGAAEAAIDLLEGKPRPDFMWEFQKGAPHAEAMRELYRQEGVEWEGYDAMATWFQSIGVEGLADLNRLSVEENRELFACRDVTGIVGLIIEGLTRISTTGPDGHI
jgi:hypothetical protein